MHDTWLGNPPLSQRPETRPRHAVALAPSLEGAEPIPLDLDLKAFQTLHIPWYTIIIIMSLDHPPKPCSEMGNRSMTPPHQGGFDGLKLLTHPFFDRSSFDDEPLIPVALATNMHKPQELKGLWLPLSLLLPVLGRKPTKLDQSGLGRVQGEAKSAEPCGQLVFKVRRLLLILKPQHDIIGKARDDDIA